MKHQLFSNAQNAIYEQDPSTCKDNLLTLRDMQLSAVDKQLWHSINKQLGALAITDTDLNHPCLSTFENTYYGTSNIQLQPGISLVSACMNRNENLKIAVNSWLQLPFDEIIIVDWSSDEPVTETLADIDDPRITILRVDDQPRWILTYAFNVGLQAVRYDKLFKLDADIILSPDFIELNPINNGAFLRGSWEAALESGQDDQVFVNGSFGCHTEDIRQVGFYNEYIRTYGWDDSELYSRLASKGLGTQLLVSSTISHIEQEHSERTENQAIQKVFFLDKFDPTEYHNMRNKYICATWDMWNRDLRQNYSISRTAKNHYQLTRETSDHNIPSWVLSSATRLAICTYLRSHDTFITAHYEHTAAADYIDREYNNNIVYERSRQLLTSSEPSLLTGTVYCDGRNEMIICKGAQRLSRNRIEFYGETAVEIMTEQDLNILNKARSSAGLAPAVFSTQKVHNLVDPKKQYFFVDAQHGLGNRLRAVASALAICAAVQRELIIIWTPDEHCECEMPDLFQYHGPILNKAPIFENFDRPIDQVTYMELEDGACKDAPITLNSGADFYIRSAYVINHPSSSWTTENEQLRQLVPHQEVQALVNSVDFDSGYACHIRMQGGSGQQLASYDSSDNWSEESHQQILAWRDKSHYSNFAKHLKTLNITPSDKVFIAADLISTYEQMELIFPNNIRALTREGDSTRGMEDLRYALADAILLSRSTTLLGSGWSSFTELAFRLSTSINEKYTAGVDF